MIDPLKKQKYLHTVTGIMFTFLIAFIGYGLILIPGFNRVGPLASAIILAILYRQFFGYPKFLQRGIEFSSKYLLRFAIILYGLKLNINIIFQDGFGILIKGAIAIILSIVFAFFIGKWLKANQQLTLLLGIGTGVCGAAAIATTAPILEAKKEETAISIGIIALIGTVFSIMYSLLLPFLPLSVAEYGIWSGLSLHELAHVALAAEPAGEDALALALLAKLGRVFLLVPLSFLLIVWMKNKKAQHDDTKTGVTFPYFLLGFIAMSLFGSYVLGHSITLSDKTLNMINFITTFLLTSAMVGLGLNVSLSDVKNKALRPLITIVITSVLLSIVMYVVTLF